MNLMQNLVPRVILGLALALLCSSLVAAQDPPVPPPIQPPPPVRADELWLRGMKPLPVEKTGPGMFRIGDITINKDQRSISFPAIINMSKGLLEYLLVRNGGKTHESLLRTTSEPYNLQLAFLLLGFEGTDRPLAFQGDPGTPKGDPVGLMIEYVTSDGKTVSLSPEQWLEIRSDARKDEVKGLQWKYTGSIVINGRFIAQSEGSIIALYHDPVAMIDNASPGGESDKIWFIKEGALPPVGTPVMVTIKAKK